MIYRAVYHAIVNTLSQESMSVEYAFHKDSTSEAVGGETKPSLEITKNSHSEEKTQPNAPQSIVSKSYEPISAPVSDYTVDYSKNIGYSSLYFKEQEKEYIAKTEQQEDPNNIVPVDEAPQFDQEPQIPVEEKKDAPEILDLVPQSREESLNELTSSRVIGTLFDTYILLETKDRTLLMIDQHAAHEKVLYEKLVALELEKNVVSQPLLAPVIVSMSRSDISFIEEHSKELTDIGFEVSSMGDSELAIRSVPAQVDPQSVSSAFIEMVDEWMHESKTRKDALILSLATSACKAAVKGHDKLHDIEIKRLLEDLSVLKDPYHCPHGRPILIRLSEKEIEKEFKRIV